MSLSIHRDIEDNYEHNNNNVDYVLENVLMGDEDSLEFRILKEEYNSELVQSCSCNDTYCGSFCNHGSNYTWDSKFKELVLITPINTCKALIECGPHCFCNPEKCLNRLVQYGPRKSLEVFDSPLYKSKGLRSTVQIPTGAFICEYAGELITRQEALKREQLYAKECEMNYILCLNEFVESNNDLQLRKYASTYIDPTRLGNIGRYINHSCDPNCMIYAVRINCPVPKICIFSKRNIPAFEELTFHYGGGDGKKPDSKEISKKCICSSVNCMKYLPNIKF